MLASYQKSPCAALFTVLFLSFSAFAQSGNSTSVAGTVLDPTGAVVPNATVTIQNPVSGLHRVVITDGAGKFSFPNLSFNPYHLTVTQPGFSAHTQDIDVSSLCP